MQLIPDRVELIVLGAGDVELEGDRAADDLVGRRLVDAALAVAAGPDAGEVAGRRHEDRLAGDRVEDLDPGPVEGGVLAVVARLVLAPLLDLLGVVVGRRVEDGHPVAHELAVGDDRELDGLEPVHVDDAGLVQRHQVRRRDHRDLLDGLEAAEARPVGHVADVLVRGDPDRAAGDVPPVRAPFAPTAGATSPLATSSRRTSFDVFTAVKTFCLPRLRLTLSNVSCSEPARDDELEDALAGLGGLADLDVDVVARSAGLEGHDAEGGLRGVRRARQLQAGARRIGAVGADADDVGGRAAVQEEAVDRVGEVRALHEVAERGNELAPVRHHHRRVRGSPLRQGPRRPRRPCRRPRSGGTRPAPPRRRRRAKGSSACGSALQGDAAWKQAERGPPAAGRATDDRTAERAGRSCPIGHGRAPDRLPSGGLPRAAPRRTLGRR